MSFLNEARVKQLERRINRRKIGKAPNFLGRAEVQTKEHLRASSVSE